MLHLLALFQKKTFFSLFELEVLAKTTCWTHLWRNSSLWTTATRWSSWWIYYKQGMKQNISSCKATDHTSKLEAETCWAVGENLKKVQVMSWQAEDEILGIYHIYQSRQTLFQPFLREYVSFLKVVNFFSEAIWIILYDFLPFFGCWFVFLSLQVTSSALILWKKYCFWKSLAFFWHKAFDGYSNKRKQNEVVNDLNEIMRKLEKIMQLSSQNKSLGFLKLSHTKIISLMW